MSETISTSVSAAAIFSAEESWGVLAPKRKDILVWVWGEFLERVDDSACCEGATVGR